MNLYEYTDYRTYLRDFYRRQKTKSASYSYRVFANRAKLTSPNYMKLVIDGERRITEKNLPFFVRGLGLVGADADYFRTLVSFQETKDVEAKTQIFAEILKLRARHLSVVKNVAQEKYEVFRQWYYLAIRELLWLDDFDPDPKWIAARLCNRVTPEEAEEGFQLLVRLGYIQQSTEGKWIQLDPLLSSSDEVFSLVLQQLHKQFLEIGMESLFKDTMETRETDGLVIAVSKSKVLEMKKKIKEFRREMNQLFSTNEKSKVPGEHEVYYLSMNLFPLTRK